MKHIQPDLPWMQDALSPILSPETIEYHYGKHHAAYYDKTNTLVEMSEDENIQSMSLEEIVKTVPPGALFNNAAQAWNHDFYWSCLTPDSEQHVLSSDLQEAIESTFGSIEDFKEQFSQAAISQFGSGWAWLVQDEYQRLSIETTSNAENPLQMNKNCLLTCDVWEHAYYIDYRNRRPEYLSAFWDIVNWNFVQQNFQS